MAMLLAQRHPVVVLDIVSTKVDFINQRQSPVDDAEL
jgi:UDP-glucose 6-dehydrogenase